MLKSVLEKEHEEMVRDLRKDPKEIVSDLSKTHGMAADLWHMGTGVATESGELLSTVKAAAIYGKPLDRENLIEELGDLEFYLEGLRQVTRITREETLRSNVLKLRVRYAEGKFSNSAAIERADKPAGE